MSTGSETTQLSLQEQREESFRLKVEAFEAKREAYELLVKSKEEKYALEKMDLEQCKQALINDQKAYELKRTQDELDLKKREDDLDLQRRTDELKIEQHNADVKNDKALIEQERLVLQQFKITNEEEKARLLELKRQIDSQLQQLHQISGANRFESFYIEDSSLYDQYPKQTTANKRLTTTAIGGGNPAQQLSISNIRELIALSKLAQERYDDAQRKEYDNKKKEQEIETERKNLEKALRLDLLRNDIDNTMTIDVIDFAMKQYSIERLKLIKNLQLDQNNARLVLEMEEIDFISERFQKKLKICQFCELDCIETNRIISLSDDELVNDSLYIKYIVACQDIGKEKLTSIIKSCQINSESYAKSNARPNVEYCCPQLGKQVHIGYSHYCKLIDALYSNQGGNSDKSNFINPYEQSQISSSSTIFNWCWEIDYKNGKIPKLTPDLKLFFSSPNITDGEWIQFYGPGTELYDIDPTFCLYVGSLCPQNDEKLTGIEFRSKNIYAGYTESNAVTRASPYQISIKWE